MAREEEEEEEDDENDENDDGSIVWPPRIGPVDRPATDARIGLVNMLRGVPMRGWRWEPPKKVVSSESGIAGPGAAVVGVEGAHGPTEKFPTPAVLEATMPTRPPPPPPPPPPLLLLLLLAAAESSPGAAE